MTLTWQVIEDNGGGLHLAVFNEDNNVVGFWSGYEYGDGTLLDDIEYLKVNRHIKSEDTVWDMDLPEDMTPQEAYDEITSYEYGCEIIADETRLYPNKMGSAGRKAFRIGEGGRKWNS